ncbi:polysaccharide deacetylase family protein [Viscerimonas tarda]
MKQWYLYILVACCFVSQAAAQTELIRIAKYKDDKAGAVSYTFDDGSRNQYLIAAPILERQRITATFFIVAGEVATSIEDAESRKPGVWNCATWDEIRSLAAKGFEIANHTLRHKNLVISVKDLAEAEAEIEEGADRIKKEVGVFPVSFCYPYNSRNEEVEKLVLKRHAVARNFERGIGKRDTTTVAVNLWIDGLITKKDWGVAMIHGLVDGFDPLNPEIFEEHLKYTKSKEQDLWIDTFGNIGCYIQERENTQIRLIKQSKNSLIFSLDTGLDSELFKAPLTIIIRAPGATKAVAGSGKIKSIPTLVKDGEIWLNCLPDGKPVTVKWK